MLNIHPQTLRQYEREGLISPSRTQGRMRLYSQRNIDRMKLILRLTRELGVNIAGVDIILQLKEQISTMQEEIEHLREELVVSIATDWCSPQKRLLPKPSSTISSLWMMRGFNKFCAIIPAQNTCKIG